MAGKLVLAVGRGPRLPSRVPLGRPHYTMAGFSNKDAGNQGGSFDASSDRAWASPPPPRAGRAQPSPIQCVGRGGTERECARQEGRLGAGSLRTCTRPTLVALHCSWLPFARSCLLRSVKKSIQWWTTTVRFNP